MHVLLVPNYSRSEALQDASQLTDFLEQQDISVVWAPDKKRQPNAQVDVTSANLVVALGGDGTLLRAAHIVGYTEVPLMGLSYGHLGFLTCAGPNHLKDIVMRALAGELHVSRRATLDIAGTYIDNRGEEQTQHAFALNDFALSHGSRGDIIEFDIAVSGHHIDRLRADGFVVATATGSTGYALSAGGPIVTPHFYGTICVPVAPHTIMARAFLSSPSDVVELSICENRSVERLFFADGQPFLADKKPTRVAITRGQGDILLLDTSASSFYQSVSRVFYGQDGHDR